jgi:anaerobic selenocysteine-containing dehydrogenase
MTAPDARGRIRAIRERGGKVVVVDPRRSETAGLASEHVSIRPGTDAALLLAMVQVLAAADRIDLERLGRVADGWPEIAARLARFTPAAVEQLTGVARATIERLALEFADAPTSVAYSRMGPNNARHATLACHAVELLNLAAGRLGEVGGAMFPTPPIDVARLARLTGTDTFGRHRSRVRGLPELIGELPATTLAEEIETPGAGQVKALLTYAGNPVLSVPNGRRLDRALGQLDFMASIDIYINETTRHADVILPPASCLAEDHLDLFFGNMRVENGAHWSRAIEQRGADERLDWEILGELTARLGGGPTAIRWVDAALRLFRIEVTPARIAGIALRMGPHGDRFLPWSKGLNPKRLQAAEHGVALGPLEPGFRRRVFHAGRRLQLAPPPLLDAMDSLAQEIVDTPPDQIVLIGRRDLRSNNSWMHNVPRLVAGKNRCVLFIHPTDAARHDVAEGARIVLESRVHRGEVTIHVTDEVREGVVSLPHGFGHRAIGAWQAVAGEHAGVSANDWVDDGEVEAIAGQSILNGVPVRLQRVS